MLSISIIRCGFEIFCFLFLVVLRLGEVSLWNLFIKVDRKLKSFFKVNILFKRLLKNLCRVLDFCVYFFYF